MTRMGHLRVFEELFMKEEEELFDAYQVYSN
jgi:hypothetical protein